MPNQFGLMDPGQLGQSIQNAFLMGAQQRALSNYAQNPSMEAATGVTGLNPEMGIKLQDRELERQKVEAKQQQEMRAAELQRRAAAGDPAAKAELAGVDFQAWNALDDNQRADTKARLDAVGQAALAVSQMDPAQQPQAWDAYVGQLAQRWPELAQYQGKFSPEALQAALAQSGLIKEALGLAEPRYLAVPKDADIVNTRDPAAVQEFLRPGAGPAPAQGAQEGAFPFEAYVGAVQSLGPQKAAEWLQRNQIVVQVQTPEQAAQLPSGSTYVTPDGQMMRIP